MRGVCGVRVCVGEGCWEVRDCVSFPSRIVLHEMRKHRPITFRDIEVCEGVTV